MNPHITRYAITHIALGRRRLTFAQQGRDTFDTREEAEALLKDYCEGLTLVLSPKELATLRVCAVECYANGDPVRYYVEDGT